MTRRERLLATLRGLPVDRPACNFYEINGCENPHDPDPFNIYADPSWQPLLELAAEKTDRLVMRAPPFLPAGPPADGPETRREVWQDGQGSKYTRLTIRAGGRTLTEQTRRDRDINTVWTIEHLLKNADDLAAWLELPEIPAAPGEVDTQAILALEAQLGDSGMVMLDTPDPLCNVASRFDLGEYTIVAMCEPELFHRALQREARRLLPRIAAAAQALPGRLWRIAGPEYASPPYLPPRLFREYVTEYVRPMVALIQDHGGYARVHSHGRLKDILDDICATGCCALDPLEPPPQGDVELSYVRQRYGEQLVLFGNLEIADIENLRTPEFEKKIVAALEQGTAGRGRGFVLMPSACPYGRRLSPLALANYRAIVRLVENW